MIRIIFIFLLLFSVSNAKIFQTVDVNKGTFIQKGDSKFYCSNCGMLLPKYYKTNHIHKDKQYCSLHCLVEATQENIPDNVKVVDTKSMKFIDARSAFYVVGSKKRGTMSQKSKYAFLDKKDALKFQKKYAGKILNFQKAYGLAILDLKKDLMILKTKREKKVYKAGKKLYTSKCNKVNVMLFSHISNLKAELKKECKIVKDKKIQMVAIYLWDIVKVNKKMLTKEIIKAPKGTVCPICAMFVNKYPKWIAMIDANKKLYFDGVKDMMKYIFSHKEEIDQEDIYVTDYFLTTKIKAKDAYFVFGSNVYGPMGNELVPFTSQISAYAFKKDHFGKRVLAFYEIDEDVLEEIEEF